MIQIGTASVNWGFDPLYNWVTKPSFDRLLDEMAAAGYSGTEISYNFPEDTLTVRDALRHRNLRAAAAFHWVDVRDPEHHATALASVDPVADRLQALGSDTVILADAPTPTRLAIAGRVSSDGSDGFSRAAWRCVGDGLNRIGEHLRERGMKAVFHPHVGTYVETRAEIERLLALTDESLIGLCPDTGHLAYAGVDAGLLCKDYADRISYVHLKDVDAGTLDWVRRERIGFVDAVKRGMFTVLGGGIVDIHQIFAALAGAEYSGWVIVEQDAPADPLAAALANRSYLRENFGL